VNTVGEVAARIEELLAIARVIDDKLNALRIEADYLIAMHSESEQRPTVTAAGRYQWRVPNQPALVDETAALDMVTLKCSRCGHRHPDTFWRVRNAALYMDKAAPYEHSYCWGCGAKFL
jgi:hypothetical protein